MRKVLAVVFIIISLVPLHAGDYHDISMSLGQQSYRWPEKGISSYYGVNIGLTERMELELWCNSALVPRPFESNMVGLELDWALLGPRSTATKIAGSALNTLIGIGGFYRTDNNGAGPFVSLTPLTVGTPVSGRREKILRTMIGYDAVNNEIMIGFSLIAIDFYVRGTWRDYSF